MLFLVAGVQVGVVGLAVLDHGEERFRAGGVDIQRQLDLPELRLRLALRRLES